MVQLNIEHMKFKVMKNELRIDHHTRKEFTLGEAAHFRCRISHPVFRFRTSWKIKEKEITVG